MRKSILLFLAVMLIAVLPGFSAVQYSLGPVDFEQGVLPAGWIQESVQGTASWVVEGGVGASLTEPLGANSGSYRGAIRAAADETSFVTRLISPAMNIAQAYNPQLSFSHAQVARFNYFDTLRVYYRVNANAEWQLLTEYTSSIAGWTSETMLLPAYQQGSAYQLAFEVSGQYGYGVVLDDISVYPQSQCQDALFQSIDVTSTSATIGFTCNGSYNHFELAVSSTPIADLRTVNLDTLTYHGTTADYESTVTGLQPYTTYYVYLRTDCDDNPSGYTNWVSTTFKTTSLVNLPYTETFSEPEAIPGNSTCGKPTGWITGGLKNVNVPAVYKGTGAKYSYSVDSTNYLFFSGVASTTATPVPADSMVYAISPEINGNLASCEIDFWGTAYTYLRNGGDKDYAAELTVGVVTNPSDIGTMEVIETVKMDNGNQFKHFRVSLAGYTGTGKYVALVSMANKPNLFYVDNFSIKQVNVCTPTNLRATNVLPTGFTLTPQLNGADSWNLKVATVYNRDASLIADSLVIVNQTGLTAASYQVQFPASADVEGKIVVVYVQGVKNGVVSEWSAPLTMLVPTTGVLPMSYDFSSNNEMFDAKYLVNERHAANTTKGFSDLISPMVLFDNYPSPLTSAPVYDGAYLKLNGVDNYVAFPYVTDPSQLEISFRLSSGAASYAGSGRVAVGVMTDPYDLTTFEEVARFDAADGTFAKVRQPLDGYTGNGHYVAIRAITPATPHATHGSHNCIDNVRIHTISTCYDAMGVTAKALSTSAVVYWEPNGMTNFKLTLYTNIDSAWVDRELYLTSAAGVARDSVVITGLTPDSSYDFTFQTICGTDTLPVEDQYSFKTSMGIPYKPTLLSNAIPTGWTRKSGLIANVFQNGASAMTTTSGGWTYNNSVVVSGLNNPHLRVNIYGTSCKYWLISPEIMMELGPNEVAALTFKAAFTDYSNADPREAKSTSDDKFAVVISTDGGNTWNQSDAYIWANDGTGNYGILDDIPYTAAPITIPLTQYAGQTIMIGFYAESTISGADNDFRISEIRVGKVDANCQGMSQLSATATGSTTGEIEWVAGGAQEAYIKITNASDSTVVFVDTITTSPYAVSNLQPNTLYNVIGYQLCSGDTLSTSFRTECDAYTLEQFGYETFAPDASSITCWKVGAADTTGVGNNRLTLPSVLNKTGFGYVLSMEKLANTSSIAYGNKYYAALPTLTIDSINKYQIVFDAATPNAASDTLVVSDLYVGVITDLEDFSTLEIVDTIHLKYAADSAFMKTYAINFDSYIGDYRGDYGKNVIFMISAPSTKKISAYIDNVRIEEAASCLQIIDLEQTGATYNSIELSWSGAAAQYEVILDTARLNTDMPMMPMYSQTIAADTVTFTNLQPGTQYYAYIRAICADGDTSVWSSFTLAATSYGVPFLETFDGMSTYPNADWKVFAQTLSGDSIFSTTGFTVSNSSYKMSVQTKDTRMSNMDGKVARTEVASATYNGFLQSPAIDLTSVPEGMGVQLSFRAAMLPYSTSTADLTEMSGRTFRVYVSEDGGNTFNAANVTEWNCDNTGDFDYAILDTRSALKHIVDLTDYVGKTIALGFYSASTVTTPTAYLLIDSVALDAYNTNCQGISKLRCTLDGKGAYATWQNSLPNTAVVVELSEDPDFSNIILRDSLVGDSLHFGDLKFNATYYVRANPECVGDWVTTSFTTIYGVPFTENFDATGTTIPSGWNRYKGDLLNGDIQTGTDWSFTASAGAGIYSPHTYCYTSTTSAKVTKQVALVSPEILLDRENANNIALTFDLALTTTSTGTTSPTKANCVGHTFAVAVLPADSNQWIPVRVWTDSAYRAIPAMAAAQTVDLTAYAGQTVRIAFYAATDSTATTSSVYHSVDDIRIREWNQACASPEVQARAISTSEVTVEWQAEAGMQYKLQVADNDDFNPILDSVTTGDSVYTFTNLTPGANIYLRAKKTCSAGCESAWSEYEMVQMPCEAITAYPWSENFNGLPTGTFEKTCWVNQHLAGNGYKRFEGYTTSIGNNATGKLGHPTQTSGTQTLLALPQMAFDSTKIYRFTISVYRAVSTASYAEEGIRLFLSDGAFINSNAEEIAFISRNYTVEDPGKVPSESALGWYTYSFILRTSGNKTIVLRGEAKNGGICYIDNLEMEEFDVNQTIDNLQVDNINNRSAHLTWSLVNSSICHNAEIVASLTALDSAALAAAPKQEVQDALSATVEGLDRETHYYIYVRTVCDTAYGDWMMAECTTTSLTYEVDTQLGDGTAAANVLYVSYGNTYSQHLYLAEELMEAGVQPGLITGIAFYYSGASASLDKTQSIYMGATTQDNYPTKDAVNFVATPQLVYGPTLHTYQQGWVNYMFTEPFIWDGVSNIAVSVLSNGDGSHATSTGWATAGTAQPNYLSIYRYRDRDVIAPSDINDISTGNYSKNRPNARFFYMQTAEACPAVETVDAELTGLGITEARVSWTASLGNYVADYDVFVSTEMMADSAVVTPQYTGIDSLSLYINNLTPETTHYIYVRANCDARGHDDGISTWTMDSITMLANCMPVKDLAVSFTNTNCVVATWGQYMEEQDNDFRYILSTTPLDTTALAQAVLLRDTTMRLVLDSLLYETTYYLYVRSACDEKLSLWSSLSFTTPASCQAVVNFAVDRVKAHAVRLTWQHAPLAFENQWEVGIVGQPAFTQLTADTFAVIAGLEGDSTYTAYVRAICSLGDTSEISTLSFTTPEAGVGSNCFTTAETPTSNGYTAPFSNFYRNSWTQMIYPAELIGMPGQVTSVSFHCASTVAFTQESVRIYMANTDMTEALTTSSWVPMEDLQLVCELTNFTHPTVADWVTIPLDEEFDYQGGNLAVVVAVHATAYSSSVKYDYVTSAAGAVLRRTSDSDASYGEYPESQTGSKSSALPMAQFCITAGGCSRVSELSIRDITTNSAVASWFPGDAETAWRILTSLTELSDAELAAVQADTITTTTAYLQSLLVDKDYYFYVAPVCSDNAVKWKKVMFATKPTCLKPVRLTVDNVFGTTASLHFCYGGTDPAAAYEVAYGKQASFDLADSTTYQTVIVSDTTALISGLQPVSYYSVAVRALCDDNDYSRWTVPVTLRTDCGLITEFPWIEDFNSYTTGQYFTADCWTNQHTQLDAAGSTYGSYVFKTMTVTLNSVSCQVMQLPNQKDGNKTMLVGPQMLFSADQPLEFAIDVYRSHYSTLKYNEGLRIYVSTSDTIDANAQLLAFIPRQYNVSGVNAGPIDAARWESYRFPIPAVGAGHIIIEGVSEYGAVTNFDNFAVLPLDTLCGGVHDLEISQITPYTAEASWTTLGNDSVQVDVYYTGDSLTFSANTTDSNIILTGLTPGTKYKVVVTQLCSGRLSNTTFSTKHTVPFYEDGTTGANWISTFNTAASSYYWKSTTTSNYVLGEMEGSVFYLILYYSYDVASRLTSPVITVPELAADEGLYLDWLMGATTYSSRGANRLDSSTVVRLNVATVSEAGNASWSTLQTWSDSLLQDIPWGTSGRFSADLSQFSGQDIKLGFYAGITEADSNAVMAVDNISLRIIKLKEYDIQTCSSVDYKDAYFAISRQDYVVGTTDYETFVSGAEGAPDTLVTMHLTVNEAVETIIYDTICEGRLYDRNGVLPFTATTSVEKPLFLTSANGCDSLVSIHIEVIPAVRRDTTILACKGSSVTISGKQYFNDIVVTDTLAGVNTCDSIVRTFIEFSETEGYTVDQHRIICAGDTYTDAAFPDGISKAGTYTNTATTAYGCDSTVTIHMMVANNGVAYDTITIKELPYVYAEDTILGTNVGATTHEVKVQASCGQVTLYITVKDTAQAVDNLKVLQLSVAPNPALVGEPIEILSQVSMAADFRLMVFDAVGQLVYSATDGSLTIPGLPVAGYYTVRLTSGGQSYQAKLLVK